MTVRGYAGVNISRGHHAPMGHVFLVLLHFVALLVWPGVLFLTLPLHVIYAALRNRSSVPKELPISPLTHARCPECREIVLKDARKCKHCGSIIAPQTAPR